MADDTCRLHPPLGGLSCGPTAVLAITGATPATVSLEIVAAANEDGEFPQHLNDSNFRHQARALERLGFALFDLLGHEIVVVDAIPRHRGPIAINVLQSLSEFLRSNKSKDVLICQGFRPVPTGLVGHTFAVDRKCYADSNTNGQVVSISAVPVHLLDFRVLDVFAVRRERAAR
jgi:hypothetical protein